MTLFHVVLLSCCVWSDHFPSDVVESMSICAREPPHRQFQRSPGDGGFRITVDDDLHLKQYVPDRVYRISITGTSLEQTMSSAYLVAVPYNSSVRNATVGGKFHLVDGGRLAFHVACSDIVTTVDSLPKAEVHVMWTSPAWQAGCVEFRYHMTHYDVVFVILQYPVSACRNKIFVSQCNFFFKICSSYFRYFIFVGCHWKSYTLMFLCSDTNFCIMVMDAVFDKCNCVAFKC